MRKKISYKIIAAVSSVAFITISVFAYVILSSHHKHLLENVDRSAHQLSETIKSSTRYDMLINQRESVHRIIETIGKQDGIEKVRVFNKEGEIIYSTDPSDIGRMVDKRAEACYACHAADKPLEKVPVSDRTRIFHQDDHTGVFGIINPIYNEPSCWESDCHAHSSEQTVLGVLDITISLDEVDAALRESEIRIILFAVIAITAISLIIYLLVGRIILRPVAKIIEATHNVSEGNLDYVIALDRKDEIGELADAFNDMTRKLADVQRQLFQSDKLASVGRLAAGVAHEINNPLTGVLTYSSFLLKHVTKYPELKEDLSIIVRETKRCREIVKGLLDFSRQSVQEKRMIQINEIVHDVDRVLRNQLSLRKVRLHLNLNKNLPPVNVDMNQIEQVLLNLMVNAADAMADAPGTITVETDVVESTTADFPEDPKAENYIRLKVIDTGAGIPSEILSKIYEPFFTTKGQKGNGLGLAIVWGIIDNHDGVISVDSKAGKGTTFTIFLPVA